MSPSSSAPKPRQPPMSDMQPKMADRPRDSTSGSTSAADMPTSPPADETSNSSSHRTNHGPSKSRKAKIIEKKKAKEAQKAKNAALGIADKKRKAIALAQQRSRPTEDSTLEISADDYQFSDDSYSDCGDQCSDDDAALEDDAASAEEAPRPDSTPIEDVEGLSAIEDGAATTVEATPRSGSVIPTVGSSATEDGVAPSAEEAPHLNTAAIDAGPLAIEDGAAPGAEEVPDSDSATTAAATKASDHASDASNVTDATGDDLANSPSSAEAPAPTAAPEVQQRQRSGRFVFTAASTASCGRRPKSRKLAPFASSSHSCNTTNRQGSSTGAPRTNGRDSNHFRALGHEEHTSVATTLDDKQEDRSASGHSGAVPLRKGSSSSTSHASPSTRPGSPPPFTFSFRGGSSTHAFKSTMPGTYPEFTPPKRRKTCAEGEIENKDREGEFDHAAKEEHLRYRAQDALLLSMRGCLANVYDPVPVALAVLWSGAVGASRQVVVQCLQFVMGFNQQPTRQADTTSKVTEGITADVTLRNSMKRVHDDVDEDRPLPGLVDLSSASFTHISERTRAFAPRPTPMSEASFQQRTRVQATKSRKRLPTPPHAESARESAAEDQASTAVVPLPVSPLPEGAVPLPELRYGYVRPFKDEVNYPWYLHCLERSRISFLDKCAIFLHLHHGWRYNVVIDLDILCTAVDIMCDELLALHYREIRQKIYDWVTTEGVRYVSFLNYGMEASLTLGEAHDLYHVCYSGREFSIGVNESNIDRIRQLANDTMLRDRMPGVVAYLKQLLPPPQPLSTLMEYDLPEQPEMIDTKMSGMEEPRAAGGPRPRPLNQAAATGAPHATAHTNTSAQSTAAGSTSNAAGSSAVGQPMATNLMQKVSANQATATDVSNAPTQTGTSSRQTRAAPSSNAVRASAAGQPRNANATNNIFANQSTAGGTTNVASQTTGTPQRSGAMARSAGALAGAKSASNVATNSQNHVNTAPVAGNAAASGPGAPPQLSASTQSTAAATDPMSNLADTLNGWGSTTDSSMNPLAHTNKAPLAGNPSASGQGGPHPNTASNAQPQPGKSTTATNPFMGIAANQAPRDTSSSAPSTSLGKHGRPTRNATGARQ